MGLGQSETTSAINQLEQEAGQRLKQTSKLLLTSLALLAVGFLGGVLTRNGFFWLLFFIGFVLLLVWFLRRAGGALIQSLAKRTPAQLLDPSAPAAQGTPETVTETLRFTGSVLLRVLKKAQVVEQWGALIPNGQGRATQVFQDSQQFIVQTKVPDVKMEAQDVASGLIRGILGGTRPFIVVSNTARPNLKSYRMYIGARDYGDNLQVSWYLVHQPSIWLRLLTFLNFIPFFNFLMMPFYLGSRLTVSKEAGFLDLDVFDLQDLIAYVTNAHRCLIAAVEKLMLELHQDPSKLERKSRGFLGIS